MTIFEMFNELPRDTVLEILSKYGVSIQENYLFSDINVVIGKNGSGKTRFLRAIHELYDKLSETTDKVAVWYGYFPDISCHINHDDGESLPDFSINDVYNENDVKFDDFMKIIENDCESFLSGLLLSRSKNEEKKNKEALDLFCTIFELLFNRKVSINKKRIFVARTDKMPVTLNDSLKEFSPGELLLFYMSVFLMILKNNTRKRVVILDEPESHLHPEALVNFFVLLKTQTEKNSEVWIATHSLFLVPKVDFGGLVYIENSKIQRKCGTTYKDIIHAELGEYENEMTDFLNSVSLWQYSQFLAESFLNPTVVDKIDPKDEQVVLFKSELAKHRVKSILDFGGGSARLGRSLSMENPEFPKCINYVVLDKVRSYFGDEFEYYSEFSELQNRKFDCAVMMNTLHEIEPCEWISVFKDISNHLEENGFLVFVEVHMLSKGERPNDVGHLILTESELQVLFSCKKNLPQVELTGKQKSVCVIIPKKAITCIDADSISKALHLLEHNSWKKVLMYHNNPEEERRPRDYAFYVQQFINAKCYNDRTQDSNENISPKNIDTTLDQSKGNESPNNTNINPRKLLDILFPTSTSGEGVLQSNAYKALVEYIEYSETSETDPLVRNRVIRNLKARFRYGVKKLEESGCPQHILEDLRRVYYNVKFD